jgi:predicted Zn-dependent protease
MINLTRSTVIAFALAISTALAGCASDRAVISQANQVHDGLKPAVITDKDLTDYMQAVGNRIIAAAREYTADHPMESKEDNSWMFSEGMKFHFVNSKTLNAFTTGGEHMYIYNELFQKCRTEDELAAVMAHEYAHVYARHVHKGINRQVTTLVAAGSAGAIGAAVGGRERGLEYGLAAGGVTLAAGQFIGMGYTRKDEAQADELGFAFYTRAGWNPKKFGDFFQQMIDLGYDTTPEIMSDHPSLANRVQDAKARAAALPPEAKQWRRPPVADAGRFKNLQAKAAELGKTLPSDQTMEEAQTLLSAFSNCFAPGGDPSQSQAREKLYGHKTE